MSSAFGGTGGKSIPGVPQRSEAQLLETKQKFERHANIVEVMLDTERADPQLLIEDLKSGGATHIVGVDFSGNPWHPMANCVCHATLSALVGNPWQPMAARMTQMLHTFT